MEVAIYSWHNPLKVDENLECCDGGGSDPPNCTDECDTRFDFCLQPAQFSAANMNCPFGRYRSPASEFVNDPDNQSFVFGMDLEGYVPNPMPFHLATFPQVRTSLSSNMHSQDRAAKRKERSVKLPSTREREREREREG